MSPAPGPRDRARVIPFDPALLLAALTLAMARDGSSGGVVRMVVITPEGVERKFFSGAQLPNALPAL